MTQIVTTLLSSQHSLFLPSSEVSFVYQLRKIALKDCFTCFPGCPVFPVSLQLAWNACELPDFGQFCIRTRQFWFCRKASSVSHLLHPGLGSGDQTGSACTYQLISVLFFSPSLLILLFSFCHFEPYHLPRLSRSGCYQDVCVLLCKTGLVLCC